MTPAPDAAPAPGDSAVPDAAPVPAGYEFSADPARMDPAQIHRLLVDHAYWAAGRSRETQDLLLSTCRSYGIFETASRTQVAYARVLTDGVAFGWLADVVVAPEHRRRGLARMLVAGLMADLEPMGIKRMVLKAAEEARPLYESFGWTGIDAPEAWMANYG